jgi:hypothetical protein
LVASPASGYKVEPNQSLTPMAWTRKLTPPLVLKDGRALKTLADARDMILGLLEGQQRTLYWQHAAGLLLYAAKDDKEETDDVRAQLMRALYRDGFM